MRVIYDYPLSSFLWYRIGGKAKYFVEVTSKEDIPELSEFLIKEQPKVIFICGLGSNLVFKDEDFDGAVIAVAKPEEEKPLLVTPDGLLTVFAGDTMDSAIQFAFSNGLIGLEWAGGLPGTVGAGVRGNVGAFGGEIKDSVKEVEVLSLSEPEKGITALQNEELNFSYRHSFIKEHPELLVLSVTFSLSRGSDEDLRRARETYEKNKEYRRVNHPLEYPNCGSVFKNIKTPHHVDAVLRVWPELEEKVKKNWHGKVSMGYIIYKLGLKGYRIGNAQISEKHCNFIVNLGGAKASEVRSIIGEVQRRCYELFGFRPEVEVEIVR